jgi:peroxin-12
LDDEESPDSIISIKGSMMNPPPSDGVAAVNPVIPTSIGALMAEEWTIDPHSTLPSFLELMMIEEAKISGWKSLGSGLKLAEQHLSRMAQVPHAGSWWTHFKARFARITALRILKPYSPELQFLIAYLLERNSLQSQASAAFWEALYGCKRIKLGKEEVIDSENVASNKSRQMVAISKQDAIRFAFLSVLHVYLVERLDGWYHRLQEQTIVEEQPKWKQLVQKAYPYLRMSVKGLHLIYQWRYLLSSSVFFDPYSHLLGLVLRRVTAQDQQQTPAAGISTAAYTPSSPISSWVKTKAMQRLAFWILSSSVAVGWLARLQSARQERRRRIGQTSHSDAINTIGASTSSTPTLPPPPLSPRSAKKKSSMAARTPTTCPLCHRPRVNPTASTGGYVFCLKCLLAFVEERGMCPITGKDCPPSRIVRLYEPHRM